MDITWYGYSCFRITERGHTSVVTDPCHPEADLAQLKLKADIVTVSQNRDAHQVDGVRDHLYVIDSPGEYEIGGLFVTGVALHQHDAENGQILGNVAYHFEYPTDLNVLHLGVLRALPDQSIIEQLDDVHALMLPLGGSVLGSDELADLIGVIEPSFVVPMRSPGVSVSEFSSALEGFLKAMGVSGVEASDSLRVSASNLPEQTQVALLQAESLDI